MCPICLLAWQTALSRTVHFRSYTVIYKNFSWGIRTPLLENLFVNLLKIGIGKPHLAAKSYPEDLFWKHWIALLQFTSHLTSVLYEIWTFKNCTSLHWVNQFFCNHYSVEQLWTVKIHLWWGFVIITLPKVLVLIDRWFVRGRLFSIHVNHAIFRH